MESLIIKRDSNINYGFIGKLLGSVLEDSDPGPIYETLNLYKNIDGRFICQKILKNGYFPESAMYDVRIVDDIDEVIDFFGKDALAQRLYKKLGFPIK